MKTKKLKTIVMIIFMALAAILIITYFALRIWIKSDINHICKNALDKYEGDKIEALISTVASENEVLDVKNHAIWALGMLRDKRALPVLKTLQTHQECNHKRFVCQRELNRAINNIEGKSINVMRFK